MKRIAGLLVALFVAASPFGFARADDAADRSAIQSIITSQITALQHDDGAAAWSYASPMIQGSYPTPEQFMAMVKTGYPQVYRPQSVTFGDLVDTAAGPVQKVYITGPDGKPYIAAYAMEQQPDGTWKINGCSLISDDTPSI